MDSLSYVLSKDDVCTWEGAAPPRAVSLSPAEAAAGSVPSETVCLCSPLLSRQRPCRGKTVLHFLNTYRWGLGTVPPQSARIHLCSNPCRVSPQLL